jgi:hypothetical protein
MSNAIVSLILVALMITTGLSLSKTVLNSFNNMNSSWQKAEETRIRTFRTDIAVIDAQMSSELLSIYLNNSGQEPLYGFSDWDVIAHYYDQNGKYYISHLAYAGTPAPQNNEWALNTIYVNKDLTQSEVFQPGIIDPGEVAKIQIKLFPSPGNETTGWIILATRDGITTSVQFSN